MFRFLQLEKRLKELEEKATRMERDWLDRDLDWVELRARCKRLLDRTEKAAHTVVQSEAPTNGGEEPSLAQPGLFLTSHQREIQQKILRRRGGQS